MDDQTQDQVEDVEEAARACRPVRSHGPWRIQIGNEHLEYRPAVIDDPVPTGLQLLELAGARPSRGIHGSSNSSATGSSKSFGRPRRPISARAASSASSSFKGSASYRFELDGRVVEWGKPVVSGLVLKKLADVDPATYGVWLEVRGADDKPIDDTDLVDLAPDGLERFFTGMKQTTEG